MSLELERAAIDNMIQGGVQLMIQLQVSSKERERNTINASTASQREEVSTEDGYMGYMPCTEQFGDSLKVTANVLSSVII
jgi:predicted SPOUT superfamily RNA methylase MTH1